MNLDIFDFLYIKMIDHFLYKIYKMNCTISQLLWPAVHIPQFDEIIDQFLDDSEIFVYRTEGYSIFKRILRPTGCYNFDEVKYKPFEGKIYRCKEYIYNYSEDFLLNLKTDKRVDIETYSKPDMVQIDGNELHIITTNFVYFIGEETQHCIYNIETGEEINDNEGSMSGKSYIWNRELFGITKNSVNFLDDKSVTFKGDYVTFDSGYLYTILENSLIKAHITNPQETEIVWLLPKNYIDKSIMVNNNVIYFTCDNFLWIKDEDYISTYEFDHEMEPISINSSNTKLILSIFNQIMKLNLLGNILSPII
jgi:hypothetical protein